ncbi:uncharacterized protein T551_01484 [Pneumocystis jirovecii RU7]|uniref:Uncharacterized protein n=1 Tax=Pneumocystis jirovecii (strain RU7) TaxID=1408657 RepID=A0A0W4ZRD6_PNEJ7|nr:uncharacterized protein T551_01484 [Pneumocystis jirovecii RU7]KTW30932.1 hypothetical protein T551_01484 [Pneumocystis jirovecii RU7]
MKKTEKSLKLKSSSDKKVSEKISLKKNNLNTINQAVHSSKHDDHLNTFLHRKHKIKKLKKKGIHLLEKNNPVLAPPMELSLHNLKHTWLYKKKRIERRNVYKRFA